MRKKRKKDKTIVQEKKGSKFYKKVISEEHITVIEEPNSKFLGQVTPKSDSWKDIADSVLTFLEDAEHKQLLNFTATGWDGIVVNTGHNNDVIMSSNNNDNIMDNGHNNSPSKMIGKRNRETFTVPNLFVPW